MFKSYSYHTVQSFCAITVLFLLWISVLVPSNTGLANPHTDSNEISGQFTSSDVVEPPIFSHQSGFYSSDLNLVLSHPNPQAQIYYTTDGSDPSTESTLYSDPVRLTNRSSESNTISMIPTNRITEGGRRWIESAGTIRKGNVIRAIAVVNGEVSAETARTIFIFDEGENAYPLPVVSIITDSLNLFDDEIGIYVAGNYYDEDIDWTGNYYQRGREWERPARFEFFEPDGSLALAQDIGIRIHGGWTRRLPMKSLRLYARSDYGESRFNIKMFDDLDDDRFNRFILRNSGNDFGNSMFMDAAAQSLIRHFNVDTQAYKPVIVYLNGEYWGIHNVRERYDRRYLERVYGADPDNIDLMSGSQTVKEGDSENYEQLIQFVQSSDFSDGELYNELLKRVDIDNFLDYYSAQIYYGNTDWPQNNIDYWRSRTDYNPDAPVGLDGRWRWLLYDVDRSLGFLTDASFDMIEWVTVERSLQNNRTYPNLLLRSFLDNESFYHEFINRIADHLNTAFLPNRVSQVIDSLKTPLNPVIEEHIHRWQNHRSRGHWENWVTDMHRYGEDRPKYLRKHMKDHFDIGEEAELRLQVSSAEEGFIRVNSIDILPETPGVSSSPYPWSGIYFSDVPVTLTAVAHDCY
ncbi:MAG: CotH kinase family protein [Balneolaceae bacterium]|nr:CotH kinase family protein [Balneolaceae bacterium]